MDTTFSNLRPMDSPSTACGGGFNNQPYNAMSPNVMSQVFASQYQSIVQASANRIEPVLGSQVQSAQDNDNPVTYYVYRRM